MKLFNKRFVPLKTKLLYYFLLFGFIILTILWAFHNFFLESTYTISKQKLVERNAKTIARSITQQKNVRNTIENVASENSLAVYVYDSKKSPFEVKYECDYANKATSISLSSKDVNYLYLEAANKEGHYTHIYKNTPSELLQKRLDEKDNASPDEIVIHSDGVNHTLLKNIAYADIITLDGNQECFLLITSPITPLSNTLEIIKYQMILVSIAFVLLAVIFSLLVSHRIARPISETNNSAKELAKKNYDVEFNAQGYIEVEELNETLNYAKVELAATERFQKELIANISHDLRTPLTMISGYAEVMRDLPGENTPENVQVIIDEANRLTSLVNDLLDLSKLQSGALRAEKHEYCLTDSIKDIFSRYSKLIEQEGFTIDFVYEENIIVNADELKLTQVVYNLMNNAINHVGEDKTVIVTQKIENKKVVVEVTDHGEGIPADKLQDIWNRYFKVDKEHKRGIIGTGLGLNIVKSILDAHNAHCGVRSTLGKGSTFWFEMDYVSATKKNNTNE